jgi:hypothetical protein
MALTSTPLCEPTVLQALVDRVPRLLAADFLDQSDALDAYPTELLSSLRAALEQGERVKFVAYLSCVDTSLRDACSHLTDKTSNPLDSLRHHVKCSALKVVMRELEHTRLLQTIVSERAQPGAVQSQFAEQTQLTERTAACLARLEQLFERVADDEDPLFPLLSEPDPWLAPQLVYFVNDPVARRWRELELQAMREPTEEDFDSQLESALSLRAILQDEGRIRVARGIGRHKVLAKVLFGWTQQDEKVLLQSQLASLEMGGILAYKLSILRWAGVMPW